MQPDEVEPAANEKAQKAKQEMKKMPPEVLQKLGFESAEQLDGAMLGDPHKVYVVNLNDVKDFKPGDDPKKIMGKTKEILYAILENGNVTSAIGFRKEKGDWIPTTLGASSEIKVAEPVRDKHGKSKGKGHSSYFVARVPAMYLSFLGYWDKNNIFFIAIAANPDFPELDPSREIPAAEAFLALQAKAEKYEALLKDRPEETR